MSDPNKNKASEGKEEDIISYPKDRFDNQGQGDAYRAGTASENQQPFAFERTLKQEPSQATEEADFSDFYTKSQLVVKVNETEADMEAKAPTYDGFYFEDFSTISNTVGPWVMKDKVHEVLEELLDNNKIDCCLESDFVFLGRSYCEEGDCEFKISIFSGKESKSVVEIRNNEEIRMRATRKAFSNIRKDVLEALVKKNAIHGGFYSDFIYDSDSSSDLSDKDSESDSTNEERESEEESEEKSEDEEEEEDPEDIVERALDKKVERFEHRRNIVKLKEEVEEDEDYAALDNILEKLTNLIDDDKNFDAFATLTVLEIVEMLIQQDAEKPENFEDTVEKIKGRWATELKNTIIDEDGGVIEFFFCPSQRVEAECDEVLRLLLSRRSG